MLTKLWSPGVEISESSLPIYCREKDKDLLLAEIKKKENCFRSVYAISPNGENLLDLIDAYQRAATLGFLSQNHIDETRSPLPIREIFRCCSNISYGLREYNSDVVILSCNDLHSALCQIPSQHKNSIPAALWRVAEYLQYLASECLRPIEFGSPFIHNSNDKKHKDWWNTQASLVLAFGRAKKKFNVEFPSPSSSLQPILGWLNSIESRLKKLQAIPQTTSGKQSALIEASAFCASIAERNLMRGYHAQSILLLHRAADLLLISLCAQYNAIDFAHWGGKYTPAFAPATGSNVFTLKNSLDVITPKLSPHLTRRDDFEQLNSWRNLLMQTHYMTDLNCANALSIFNKVRPHLDALGGSQWRAAHKEYLDGIRLTPLEILDSENNFSVASQLVTY